MYYCSSELINSIKQAAKPATTVIGGLELVESPLFPFELKYDACDLNTKEEIKIPSGEWIHGMAVSQPDFNHIEPMMQPEPPKRWFHLFMEHRVMQDWAVNPYCRKV
jgi:hypothetical protein